MVMVQALKNAKPLKEHAECYPTFHRQMLWQRSKQETTTRNTRLPPLVMTIWSPSTSLIRAAAAGKIKSEEENESAENGGI